MTSLVEYFRLIGKGRNDLIGQEWSTLPAAIGRLIGANQALV